MKAVLVSGIHTTANEGGMYNLAVLLRSMGVSVRVYAYPKRWALFSVWFKRVRDKDAKGLLHFCEGDGSEVIISHSNGSLVTQDAMQLGLKTKGWISLGGAATSDKVFYSDSNFEWAISVYNPHDLALKVGSWIPFHGFGKLGCEGYRGDPNGGFDTRWKNVNGASNKALDIDHSHYTGREIKQWAEFIYNNIKEGHSQLGIIREV